VQPDLRTVQGVLQDLLLRITREQIVLEFAGRTDAGVHAVGQVVSFESSFRHGPEPLLRAMNSLAPPDLSVASSSEVPAAFHARRSARQRWYRYTVQNGRYQRPLTQRSSHFFPQPLDVDAMNAASRELLGTHDFLAFGDVPGDRASSVRRLDDLHAEREGDSITIDLKASAFLKHMARSMAGLLLRAGTGAIDATEARRVLDQRDRHAAGPVAPAKGLCLMGVTYDNPQSPLPLGEGDNESPLPLGEGQGEGSC
jgi:tRNA pseudouridine38-40 synthase